MINDKYKTGEKVTQKLFEMTGDPRFHNMRKGFEDLRNNNKTKQNENEESQGREM